MNVYEEIRAKSGTNFEVILRGINVRATDICDKYQALYDAGEYNNGIMSIGSTPEEMVLRDAYNEIRKTVLTGWLSQVSRDNMLGMLNAMSPMGDLIWVTFLPGESIGIRELMCCWNEANPEERPIGVNPDYLP